MQVRRRAFESGLLIAGTIIWIAAAIHPVDRAAWYLENMTLAAAVAWVLGTYRAWPLSRSSYFLIFCFFLMHVAGAHYTYSETPIGDWLRPLLGEGRNHYDRVVHFCFGLLLVSPFRDQMKQAIHVGTVAAWAASLLIITSISTVYELAEWAVAVAANPDNAIAFLGTQGDVFDSQKDTALAILGAVVGLILALTARGFLSRAGRAVGRT